MFNIKVDTLDIKENRKISYNLDEPKQEFVLDDTDILDTFKRAVELYGIPTKCGYKVISNCLYNRVNQAPQHKSSNVLDSSMMIADAHHTWIYTSLLINNGKLYVVSQQFGEIPENIGKINIDEDIEYIEGQIAYIKDINKLTDMDIKCLYANFKDIAKSDYFENFMGDFDFDDLYILNI